MLSFHFLHSNLNSKQINNNNAWALLAYNYLENKILFPDAECRNIYPEAQ